MNKLQNHKQVKRNKMDLLDKVMLIGFIIAVISTILALSL